MKISAFDVGIVLLLCTAMLWSCPAGAAAHHPTKHSTPHVASKAATPPVSAGASNVPAEPRLSNFADLVVDGIVGENAPEVDADFAAGLSLASTPLLLERTTLDQVQAADGGLLHTQGDGDSTVTWLCYTRHAPTKADTPMTMWLIADGNKAPKLHVVSRVVVENVDAAKVSGCATAEKAVAFPTFGVPAIGASLAEIKTRFGTLIRDRQHNAYYNSTRPLNDGSGQSVYQTLGYLIDKSAHVTGVALSQMTTD